jgi:hypothetical protein
MSVFHGDMKLGKKPPKIDPRTFCLGKYLTSELPAAPAEVCNSRDVQNWGMMLNDTLGTCPIAGALHTIQGWVLSNVEPGIHADIIMPSDDIVLRYYEQWCGYEPSDPSTDHGGVLLDVLRAWHRSDMAGYKLLAYADPDPMNSEHVKQAINLFGGLYTGLQLPISAQRQDTWDLNGHSKAVPGSWGGHCVEIVDYDSEILVCKTWGKLKAITWRFFAACVDECHALLSGGDWVPPAGFDLAGLQQDLLALST